MQPLHISEKQSYRIKYLVIPDFVFQNDNLSYLAAKLYSFIHSYRAPEFFFSNEKLAELFHTDVRAIQRALAQLREEKLISTEQPNGRKRFIVDLWGDNFVIPGVTEVSSHLEADGVTDLSSHNLPNEGSIRRKKDENSIPNKNIVNKNTLKGNLGEIPNDLDSKDFRDLMPIRKKDRPIFGFSRGVDFRSQPSKGFPQKGGVADGSEIY